MVTIEELPADTPAHKRVYLATPCYGCHMTVPFLASVLGLQAMCTRQGIELTVDFIGNESLVERARNILAARFLASPCTHLLFVDADIGFRPESVLRLLQADKDVATGVYSKKAVDWEMVKRKIAEGATEPVIQMGLDFNININRTCEDVVDGFVRVLDSATGFMLIKRGVIERMTEHYKEELACVNDIQSHSTREYVALFSCIIDPDTRRYLSEDYSFCRRFQQLGGEIWADIASPLAHIGTSQFVGDVTHRVSLVAPEAPATTKEARAPPQEAAKEAPATSQEAPESSASASKQAPQAPGVPRVQVAVVVQDKRREVSLMCAINLLKLQTAVVCMGRPLFVEVHFASSTEEALNLLRAGSTETIGSFVCASHLGFDPQFVIRCLDSAHPLIIGSYPLPGIDWEAVLSKGRAGSTEPPHSWGCRFNTELAAPTADGYADGYAVPDRVLETGLVWVRKAVVDDIVTAHPGIVSAPTNTPNTPSSSASTANVANTYAALCAPGVYDGVHLTADGRFLQLAASVGITPVVDVRHPAVSTGPMEFGGCVGARTHLR